MGCICRCRENCLILLWSHPLPCLKGYGDWGNTTLPLVFKKRGQRDSLENYGLLSFGSFLVKMMEWVLLEDVSGPMKENKVMENIQHGFAKHEWCLINMITFYDKISGIIDNGRAQDVIYLDFTKAFDTLPQYSCSLVRTFSHAGWTMR